MLFLVSTTGSPIEARTHPEIYIGVGIALGVAVVLIFVRFLLSKIRKQHSSTKWIEKQKKLPTTKKNVAAVARDAKLTATERDLLWELCRRYDVPNIEYTIRDDYKVNGLCHDFYTALNAMEGNDDKIYALFTMRFKLEKLHDSTLVLRTTQQLREGQSLVYTTDAREKFTVEIVSNDQSGMYLRLPQELLGSDKKPAELSKLNLSFMGSSGITYQFESRAVRYEVAKDGKTNLFASHSNSLKALQRRMTKRMAVDQDCEFSAAKDSGKKNKDGTPIFEIMEKRHPGKLQDLSATGCRLLSSMPIVRNQHMSIYFSVGGEESAQAVGTILATRRAPDESGYVLHIQFVEIAPAIRNRIYASVYGYLS